MARIVIAEDDAHILRVLVLWLEQHGHEVFECRDGVAALEQVRAQRPDVLITDVNMPRMTGTKLTIQALDLLPPPFSVVVFTSRCDRSGVMEELPTERVQIFPKPFSPAKLVDEITRLTAAQPEEVVA